jgi:transcriptional activator SPT7
MSRREHPDFYKETKRPMDLRAVTRKIRGRKYKTFKAFQEDIELIFSNCIKYFNGNSNTARRCKELRTFYFKKLEEMNIK